MTPWRFVFVADMQPGSPRSFRYNPSWRENWREARRQILELEPDLLLVGGDLTRDGSLHRFELEEMKADLDALPFPVHVIAGNMDTGNKHTRVAGTFRGPGQCSDIELNVTSEQLQQFAAVFGPLWWTFEHKGIRFSGLADGVVNSGLPEEAAFWNWAEKQLKGAPPAGHHIWMMHSPPFLDRPDEPSWDIRDPAQYRNWYFSVDQPGRARLLNLFRSTQATRVLCGHVHLFHAVEAEGIRYVIGPATSFVQWVGRWPDARAELGFLLFEVHEQDLREIYVPLRRVHQIPGYGPGGHPSPDHRDYSLAWEPSSLSKRQGENRL